MSVSSWALSIFTPGRARDEVVGSEEDGLSKVRSGRPLRWEGTDTQLQAALLVSRNTGGSRLAQLYEVLHSSQSRMEGISTAVRPLYAQMEAALLAAELHYHQGLLTTDQGPQHRVEAAARLSLQALAELELANLRACEAREQVRSEAMLAIDDARRISQVPPQPYPRSHPS